MTPAIDQAVTFSGDLKRTTQVAGLAGRAVSLWARSVGSSAWTKVADDTTGSAGHYALTAGVPRAADYQMRWAGGPTYAPSASPLVRLTTPPRTAPKIDLNTDKTTVGKGEPLMLYGHVTEGVSPAEGVADLTVSYYKRTPGGGPWILVGKCTSLAPTGWHSIVVHPMVKREWRAVVTGNHFYKSKQSNHLVVSPR